MNARQAATLATRVCTLMPSVEEESLYLKVRNKNTNNLSADEFLRTKSTARRVSSLSSNSVLSDASTFIDFRRPSHDLSGFEPTLEDFTSGRNTTKYSIQFLLKLRECATDTIIDLDYGVGKPLSQKKKCKQGEASATPLSGEIVKFRAPGEGKKVPHNAISFHEDLDITADCIVHVFNLDESIDWPHLQTFCTKSVGLKPLNIRMQRRRVPCRAMVLFNSAEEARRFVQMVPQGAKLKGKAPRFAYKCDAKDELTTLK